MTKFLSVSTICFLFVIIGLATTSTSNKSAFPKTAEVPTYIDEYTFFYHDFQSGPYGNNPYIGYYGGMNTEFTDTALEGNTSIILNHEVDEPTFCSGYNHFEEYPIGMNGTMEVVFVPTWFSWNSSLNHSIYTLANKTGHSIAKIYVRNYTIYAEHMNSATGTKSQIIASNVSISENSIYHLAYSFGEEGQFLYLNNELVAQGNFDQGITLLDSPTLYLYLGVNYYEYPSSWGPFCPGIYDLFKFSTNQRSDFSDLPAINDINLDDAGIINPPIHLDQDTLFLFCNTIEYYSKTTISNVEYDSIYSTKPGIFGKWSTYFKWRTDATQYFTCDPGVDLTAGTIDFDFYPLYSQIDNQTYQILNCGTENNNSLQIFLYNSQIYAKHESQESTSPTLVSNDTLASDTYYHIAYSFGPSGTFLYINDELVANSSYEFGLRQPDEWTWVMGSFYSSLPAYSVFENLRLSSSQRSNFSEVTKLNPLFSRDQITEYYPEINFVDTTTLAFLDFENGWEFRGRSYYSTYIPAGAKIEASPGIYQQKSGEIFFREDGDYSIQKVAMGFNNWTNATIETTFCPKYLADDEQKRSVMFVRYNSDSNSHMAIYTQHNSLYAYREIDGSKSHLLKSNISLQMDEIYHISYTFGDKGSFLYINDEIVAADSNSQGFEGSSKYFLFGLGKVGTDEEYQNAYGIYDHFRLREGQHFTFPRPEINGNFSSTDQPIDIPPFPIKPIEIEAIEDGLYVDTSLDGNESVGYAILCGVRDYPSFTADLKYTEKDINDFQSFTNNKMKISVDNTQILLNSEATSSNIQNAFIDTKSKMDDNDYLFFVFSGHGSPSYNQQTKSWSEKFDYLDLNPWDKMFDYRDSKAAMIRVHFKYINLDSNADYLFLGDYDHQDLTWDFYTGSHSDIWSSWIEASQIYIHLLSDGDGDIEGFEIDQVEVIYYEAPYFFHPYDGLIDGFSTEEFAELVNDMPGKLVCVFDACFSGAFCRAMQGPNRLLFASCEDNRYALESPVVQNGLFTHYFIDSWDQLFADPEQNPPDLVDVYRESYDDVVSLSNTLGYTQRPLKFDQIYGEVVIRPYLNISNAFIDSSNRLIVNYLSMGLGLGELDISLYSHVDNSYTNFTISDISVFNRKIQLVIPLLNSSSYAGVLITASQVHESSLIETSFIYGDYVVPSDNNGDSTTTKNRKIASFGLFSFTLVGLVSIIILTKKQKQEYYSR